MKDNFDNQVNAMLISSRRWGKSSLVKRVASEVASKKLRIVEMDLLGIRDEEEFYKLLATETIKATGNKVEEWLHWRDLERHYKEILNLPEKIAEEKNLHIIVCIDEFQNMGIFRDPLLFQKRLSSEWQHQQRVSYCLYGSQQHMMMELFERQSMPFYKFGDVIYPSKISREDWVEFITGKFEATGKSISEELADKLAALVQDHSYYVQQLSHKVWINSEATVFPTSSIPYSSCGSGSLCRGGDRPEI